MKEDIIFEIASEKDCAELARLKLAVWKTTYIDIYPKEKFSGFDFNMQTEKFKKCVSDKNGIFYIAKDKKT